MTNNVTTCIVCIAHPATATQEPITGVAFLWLGKTRTLWFRNYSFPRFARPARGHRSEYNRSKMSVDRRVELKHDIPRLRIFATRSQSGAKAFHIEKASGNEFEAGQIEIVNLRG
jgi:hypothetical protein